MPRQLGAGVGARGKCRLQQLLGMSSFGCLIKASWVEQLLGTAHIGCLGSHVLKHWLWSSGGGAADELEQLQVSLAYVGAVTLLRED